MKVAIGLKRNTITGELDTIYAECAEEEFKQAIRQILAPHFNEFSMREEA